VYKRQAYTAVDKAESEPELAFAVNMDGPPNLADACKKLGIPLVHISTDYVFDGTAKRPYREDDPANPLGVYGQSKREGEEAVRSIIAHHIILRISWLFGTSGHNFVKTILKLSREKEDLRVVADQKGCPTWTGHVSDALVRVAARIRLDNRQTPWGTYHFCGKEPTSWYDFAWRIVQEGRLRETLRVNRILPIMTSEYRTAARRPMYSVLDCSKIERTFGISPKPWVEGLSIVVEHLSRIERVNFN